jgi:hypothetical protein
VSVNLDKALLLSEGLAIIVALFSL